MRTRRTRRMRAISARALSLTVFLLCFGCMKGIPIETKGENVALPGFTPLNGIHGESTAIRNALAYQGVSISEALIAGFASAPSFAFITHDKDARIRVTTPAFLENFTNALALSAHVQRPQTAQDAYDAVKAILKKGVPVVLRVNARFLPYRHGGKYGKKDTSYDEHYVTLFALDEREGIAKVADIGSTSNEGAYSIRIPHLARARNSGAKNLFYYFKPRTTRDVTNAFTQSLHTLLRAYERPDGTLARLARFSGEITNCEAYLSSVFALDNFFTRAYRAIAVYNVGAGRALLQSYLYDAGKALGDSRVVTASLVAQSTVSRWNALAEECRVIGENVGAHFLNKSARTLLYAPLYAKAEDLSLAEHALYARLTTLTNAYPEPNDDRE